MNPYVLIVDDDDLNREIIAEYISDAGYQYDMAENGLEAVNLAAKNAYDVILMDIMIPVMDGLVATMSIRADHENDSNSPKIVAVTAKRLHDTSRSLIRAGFNEYLAKPYTESDILTAVSTSINPLTSLESYT
jgi:CheY-like chemotaxis protein